MRTIKTVSGCVAFVLALLVSGCARPKNNVSHGLMWYRPPPQPGKPLSVCVAVHGGTLQVDRTAVARSEATNWEEPGFGTGRLGRTASVSSSQAGLPAVEAPWAASAAVRSSDSAFAPRVGGTISETGSWDERPTTLEVGPPGCCTGLLAPLAPR